MRSVRREAKVSKAMKINARDVAALAIADNLRAQGYDVSLKEEATTTVYLEITNPAYKEQEPIYMVVVVRETFR